MRHPLLKRRLRLLLKPPLRLSFKHQRLKRQLLSPRHLLHLLLQKHRLLSLRLLPHQLLLKHRLLPLVQLSQVEPLRANQRVMRHVKFLAPLLRAPLLHVRIHRARRPLVARLAQPLLVVPLVRRLVVQSAQLVVQFRRRLVVR